MIIKLLNSGLKVAALLILVASLSGCNSRSVYGSIGVSSGYSSHGSSGARMHGSISIGGRIR